MDLLSIAQSVSHVLTAPPQAAFEAGYQLGTFSPVMGSMFVLAVMCGCYSLIKNHRKTSDQKSNAISVSTVNSSATAVEKAKTQILSLMVSKK